MTNSREIPDRKRILTTNTDPARGHELARIAERLPGDEPTDAGIYLTDGPTYEARYWRCLGCGEERNQRQEFHDHCASTLTLAQTDGGYSIMDDRTRAALAEDMSVHPDRDDGVYGVRGESNLTHRVDLHDRTCTCADFQRHRAFCKHLRRVDIEVRTGTIPDVDA